jgi:hypothetical protein
MAIWGEWRNNAPRDICAVRVKAYTVYIPYSATCARVHRPRKCLVCNEGKERMYVATIERYPEGTKNKREYSVVVEKVFSMRETTVAEAACFIDLRISSCEESALSYLNYMSIDIKAMEVTQKEKGFFVTTSLESMESRRGAALGLLLDAKKLTTKAVGMFACQPAKGALRNGCDLQDREEVTLNGLGLSKTIESS